MKTEEKSPIETVNEFYRLLTEHEVPEGWTLPNLPPKMTGEQAFALIYYLQEGPRLLPDHIERCEECGELADSWSQNIEYIESIGKRLCEGCYQSKHGFACCACENHDCHTAPGRLAVVAQEVQGLLPGLYQITEWPFWADGMISGYLYEDTFKHVGEVPEKADTGDYAIGFLCVECETAINTPMEADGDELRPCVECGETIGQGAGQHTCDCCGELCCTACSHDADSVEHPDWQVLCDDCQEIHGCCCCEENQTCEEAGE